MMENARRNLAELSRRMLGGSVRSKRIAVLCGAGNNGGGGMAAARHLHDWGADILLKVPTPRGHLADFIIDAMIGYGLAGDPSGIVADWIQRVNNADRPVLALDTPSGLNATTGIPGNPCIRAAATVTLALPKVGLMTPQAQPFVGDLFLADIGVPPELYAAKSLGLDGGLIFVHDTIINMVR